MTRLRLNLESPGLELKPAWGLGGNVGDAETLLAPEVRRHLLLCRDELGWRSVRCRGMLDEPMARARGDGSFDFDRAESALDWMMENGLTPFLDLAPRGSVVGSRTDRIHALAVHVDGRYGCDARDWRFELADDADFDAAVASIKLVHPEYNVGVAAGASAADFEAFLARVSTRTEENPPGRSRCDFVSLDPTGAIALADARRKITESLGEHIPLIVSRWGQPASARDNPDACGHAATVASSAVALGDICQGAFYASVSDLTDVSAPNYEPFHGGPGLVTVNDVRKAAFHALRLLNEHGGYHTRRLLAEWEDAPPGLGCLATRSEYTVRLLFWLDPSSALPGGPVRFTIEGLPDLVRQAELEAVRPGAGSPFEVWTGAGRPRFANLELLEALEIASHAAKANVDFHEYPPRLEAGMVMQMMMTLPLDEPPPSAD